VPWQTRTTVSVPKVEKIKQGENRLAPVWAERIELAVEGVEEEGEVDEVVRLEDVEEPKRVNRGTADQS